MISLLPIFVIVLIALAIGYLIGWAMHERPTEKLMQRQAEIAFEQGVREAHRVMEAEKRKLN